MIATTSRPAAAPPGRSSGAADAVVAAVPCGDGRSQRHAGFLFRRRPVHRAGARAGAGPPHDRGRRRHHRHRRGIHPALWRRKPVTAEEELARLQPVLADVVALGVPVSIDSMKAGGRLLGARAGRAIVNDVWGLQRDPDMARAGRPARRAGHRHAQPLQGRADHRHRGRHRAFFAHSLDIADKAGIPRDAHRARSRHRLRQDPGAEHGGARPARRIQRTSACRSWSARRASASSTRCRRRSRCSGSAARSPPM